MASISAVLILCLLAGSAASEEVCDGCDAMSADGPNSILLQHKKIVKQKIALDDDVNDDNNDKSRDSMSADGPYSLLSQQKKIVGPGIGVDDDNTLEMIVNSPADAIDNAGPDDIDGAYVGEEIEEIGGYGQFASLTAGMTVAIVNLSNFSGLVAQAKHTRDPGADLRLLNDKVEGFYALLHDAIGPMDANKYCPLGQASRIRECMGIALCLIQ